jgi:hypothetical protein
MTYGRALGDERVTLEAFAAVSHGLTSSPRWGEGTASADSVPLILATISNTATHLFFRVSLLKRPCLHGIYGSYGISSMLSFT